MTLSDKKQQRLSLQLAILVGIFFTVTAYLAIQQYVTFHTRTYDLAIYDQMIWGISMGNYYSTVREIHVFAHHLQPVLWFLAFFYRLGAGPQLLLVLQAAAVALSAVPFFLLVRDRYQSSRAALIWVILLLAYPPLHYLTLADFHPGTLAIPLLFLMMWYHYRQQFFGSWCCALLALCCQENIALALAGWGLANMLHRQGTMRSRKHGLAMFVLFLGYFIAAIFWIKPAFAPAAVDTHFKYYDQFGASYAEIVQTVLQEPERIISYACSADKIFYLWQLLIPLALLPLVAPRLLLPVLPILAINLLSNHPGTTSIKYHFSFAIIPFLVVAAVSGYNHLCRTATCPVSSGYVRCRRMLPYALGVLVIVSFLLWSPLPGGSELKPQYYRFDDTYHAYRDVLAKISPTEAVSVPIAAAAHLSHRSKLYIYPSNNDLECNVVVIDIKEPAKLGADQDEMVMLAQRLNNVNYLLAHHFSSEVIADKLIFLRRE